MTREWRVKGEGRANVVFEYTGSNPEWRGKVLRVAKRRQVEFERGAEELERELWFGTAVADKTKKLEKNVAYVQTVIGPKLGQHFVEQGRIVEVPRHLCANHGVVNQGWLLPDNTMFTEKEVKRWHGKERVLSLEMKPKCGFIPDAKTMDPAHDLKRNTPRFLLHQFLKLKQGRVSSVSDYSPLELFSGNVSRMQHALMKLMHTPQNNLALFLDGERLPVTDEGLMNASVSLALQEVLHPLWMHHHRESPSLLLTDLVAKILHKEGVLAKILSLQKLDRYDIEGIYPLYCHLRDQRIQTGRTDNVSSRSTHEQERFSAERCRKMMCFHCLKARESLKQLSIDVQLRLLRDWLISATAKDCSIFLTFRLVQTCGDGERIPMTTSFPHLLSLEGSNIQLLYKVQLSDLDLKPLSKIPYQFLLDEQIVTAAQTYQDKNSF